MFFDSCVITGKSNFNTFQDIWMDLFLPWQRDASKKKLYYEQDLQIKVIRH